MTYRKRHQTIETVIVLCEGSSENMYLQELNRYFRENAIPLVFSVRVIGCGAFRAAMARYREARRGNRKTEIIIWVDKDIYLSSQKRSYELKPSDIPDFLFSTMNFEDFLVLHLDRSEIYNWQAICKDYGHFQAPMTSSIYMPLFKACCVEHYRKGKLPFRITKNVLERLFANLERKNIIFDCDFGRYLKNKLRVIYEHMGVNQPAPMTPEAKNRFDRNFKQ